MDAVLWCFALYAVGIHALALYGWRAMKERAGIRPKPRRPPRKRPAAKRKTA